MLIHNTETAREFVTAWLGSSPRRRAFYCKLASDGIGCTLRDAKADRARQAARRVLHLAERYALCEVLGWSTECVATVSELWEEVNKVA